jgi:serine/threonine protein kinase
MHRDLKLDNIIVPIDGNTRKSMIINFCYSENYAPGGLYTKCGTPGFVAPEIFHSKYYDLKVDLFSLGVILYTFIYGQSPFSGCQ